MNEVRSGCSSMNVRRPSLGLWGTVALGCLLSAVIGCGGDKGLKRYPIQGKVNVSGKPVDSGTIAFYPAEGVKGPQAGANIVDGKYEIAAADGAVSGKHRVDILALRKTGKKRPNMGGEMVIDDTEPMIRKGKYDGAKSELSVDIKSGPNEHNFDLTP